MTQPEGFVNSKFSKNVCKLNKGVYVLKEAPRKWYEKISNYIVHTLRMPSGLYDTCSYVRKRERCPVLLTLYVDTPWIAGSSLKGSQSEKASFPTNIEMEDSGEAGIFLGL